MIKEVIPIKEITNFQSRTDEFFPVAWYKKMLAENLFSFMKKQILGMCSNMIMLNRY